ncbi:MAG: hypothetical protein HGB10_08505 [Coriobacteriia bacterium]|nr:hypothetical protein [Coriobacteriia bacterium]
MPSSLSVRLAAMVLLATVVATAGGCAKPAGPQMSDQSQLATATADASSSASASGSADASAAGGSAGVKPTGPLTSSDAKAIEAELSAIEKELESMSLPGDGDFGGIESGLE